MKIVCAGVSGLIGRPLVEALQKEHDVIRLKRGAWREWAKETEGADAVINLAGENIAGKRWSAKQKEELKRSRLETTRVLVEAVLKSPRKPKVFINASAIGFYGARDASPVDENASRGTGFLPELCEAWEREAARVQAAGVRAVFIRTGIVLAKEEGALAKMKTPFFFFAGGPLGDGKQFMSWVHLDDEVNAILHCLKTDSLSGPVNLTAPKPVSMKEFAATLGRVMKRPSWAPVPAFVLKTLLGEMSEMLLTGQNVLPEKLRRSGFRFRFESLEPALKDLLAR